MKKTTLYAVALVVVLALLAGVLVWMGKRLSISQSVPAVTKEPTSESVAISQQTSVSTFEQMIQMEVGDVQPADAELYISEKNKFSVRIPRGTKVNERDEEGGYTLTYFDFGDSVHTIVVASHQGSVNADNLQEMITEGRVGYLLTGGFNSENRVQCGDSSTICFMSRLYSQPTVEFPAPLLMRLVEHVISQSEFPRFYSFEIGAYHPPLNRKDISLFKQFHESFRLLRK